MQPRLVFNLPLDVRVILYDCILADHQIARQSVQPSNAHLNLIHTYRRVYYEAGDTFRRYLSPRNEFQIQRFHHYISTSPETAFSVRWIDVANDGRIVESLRTDHTTPASDLYLMLAKLTSLEKLRVFDVRHYHPFTGNGRQLRYRLDFEGVMCPTGDHGGSTTVLPHLSSYELYLDPSTRVGPFDRLPGDRVQVLRLSGDCHLPPETSFPALRHLTIRSVTSNAFDKLQHRFHGFTTRVIYTRTAPSSGVRDQEYPP